MNKQAEDNLFFAISCVLFGISQHLFLGGLFYGLKSSEATATTTYDPWVWGTGLVGAIVSIPIAFYFFYESKKHIARSAQ